MLIGGHEDGTVKLYDLRTSLSGGVKQHKTFESTTSYISQVRICPKNRNLFASCGYDGKIRMWDVRNETEPLHVLKKAGKETEFKQFALSWYVHGKGEAQIVSGGSDSNILVYNVNI